ncbi:MAG: OmpA family protein [Pseudomonadota bacterium]|nr:OmpA family protein [Pseudomonadota bacterium]
MAAALLSGCSSVPDWANPVQWYEGVAEAISGENPTESSSLGDAKIPQTAPGANKEFPNLSTVPKNPSKLSDKGRKRLARKLVADRENAKYSEEKIQRQSKASIPPPPKPATLKRVPLVTPVQPDSSPETSSARAASPRLSVTPTPSSPSRLGPTPPSRNPRFAPPPPKARATVPRGAEVRLLDARRSPSVRSIARVGNPVFGPPPADIASALGAGSQPALAGRFPPVKLTSIAGTPSAQSVAAGEPVGVIRFRAGSSQLSSRDRQGLRGIAQSYRRRGGGIRVEGHASSRTRNMDPVRHHLVNLSVSLNRANAVTRELLRAGVPQEAIFVAALSDSRPIYQEVMPTGDAGNQRVEVYFVN